MKLKGVILSEMKPKGVMFDCRIKENENGTTKYIN